MCLYDLKKKHHCTIDKMPKNELLESLGLREGVRLSILTKQPFGGPIVVKLRNRNIAIDKNVAMKIVTRGVELNELS